ncbi:MAG: hypothetical protein WBG37_14930 [Desulfobacterales bacterium]
MGNHHLKYIRLAGLFGLGCLLFSYPLVALFNSPVTIAGIPLLYAYLFLAWGLLIGLAWIITRFSKADQASNPRNRT